MARDAVAPFMFILCCNSQSEVKLVIYFIFRVSKISAKKKIFAVVFYRLRFPLATSLDFLWRNIFILLNNMRLSTFNSGKINPE